MTTPVKLAGVSASTKRLEKLRLAFAARPRAVQLNDRYGLRVPCRLPADGITAAPHTARVGTRVGRLGFLDRESRQGPRGRTDEGACQALFRVGGPRSMKMITMSTP